MRQITYLPDGYQFDIPDASLSMQFRDIHKTSAGLFAEVEIFQTLSGEKLNHYWADLNLLAGRSKVMLAKQMAGRVASYDGWEGLIEELCYLTAQEFRKPTDAVIIGETEPPPRTWRLYPFIEKSEPSIFFGEGGSGKTMLACLHAICISSGLALAGMEPVQGNVMMVDYEADRDTIERRIRRICRGLGIKYQTILYYRGGVALAKDLPSIQANVRNHQIDHVIVDSAMLAVGGSLENTEAVGQYFAALRTLGTSSTTIAHVAKNALNNKRSPFGSAFWTNLSRSVWDVLGEQTEGSNVLEQGVKHFKVNEDGKHPRRGFEWTFESDSISVASADINKMEGLSSLKSPVAKIRQALQGTEFKKATVKELVDSTGLSADSIRQALSSNKTVFINLETRKGVAGIYGFLSHDL